MIKKHSYFSLDFRLFGTARCNHGYFNNFVLAKQIHLGVTASVRLIVQDAFVCIYKKMNVAESASPRTAFVKS